MIKCQNPVMHQIIYGILYIIIMGSGIAHDYWEVILHMLRCEMELGSYVFLLSADFVPL